MVVEWAIRLHPRASGVHTPAEERVMPLVSIKVAEGLFTEKQKHDLASKEAYEAVDGTPITREDLATHAPVRHP
jgi:hypothetical protein